jgi:uncharacterized protein (TIGR02453 family)
MSEMPEFSGFPHEGLQFLDQLARNNNREWFQARKDDYVKTVLAPAQDFVFALGERLKTISAGIAYDTRTNGSGSILRIYRDLRFSKDKTPYNTNLRTVFWEGQRKKMDNPGFFVWIEPAGAGVFVGQHGFPPPVLKAYREAVADDEMGGDLEGALAAVSQAGEYAIGGEHYKRVPRGYETQHRRAELLKYNGLYAQSGQIQPDVISRPEFVELCFEHCRNMAPLQQWLVDVGKRFEV